MEKSSGNGLERMFSIIICGAGVEPSPLLLWLFIGLLHQPWMIDGGECGAVSGVTEWQGNPSTRRKPAPQPLCQPYISHDLTRARTRAAPVGSR
jgi:hypothetical protein